MPGRERSLGIPEAAFAWSDEEGGTLLYELFRATADIVVPDTELRVLLHALSAPHRTLAAQALCDILTEAATTSPRSRRGLHFAISPRPPIGLTLLGPRARSASAGANVPKPDISPEG